jgi:hypothetical protein
MSHELPASGWGFIWPRIIFESDGENVDVRAVGTSISESEPVQYLENFHGTISGLDFEDGVDNFIRLVIARLEAVGIKVTDLQSTWQEVLRERADPERSQFRRLEASLGFDIDDAPEATIHKYIETAKVAGESAAGEIAAALAAIHKQEEVLSLDEIAKTEGLQGRFNLPSIKALDDMGHAGPPWERGRRLADSLRSRLGLDGRIVEDELLSELLGVPAMEVTDSDRDRAVPLIGFAVRNGGGSSKLFFRKRNRPGRRFEAARFISDTMFAPAEDRWLPATDSKTARQKMQRAFAAEFLCPKDSLLQFLDGDFADEKMDEAGEHFGVSSLAVKNHLANHGIVEFGPA